MILIISVTIFLLITMITCMRGTESWQAPQSLALLWVRATQPRCRQSSKPADFALERVLFEIPTRWLWLCCWHKTNCVTPKGANDTRHTNQGGASGLVDEPRTRLVHHSVLVIVSRLFIMMMISILRPTLYPDRHHLHHLIIIIRSDTHPQTAAGHLLALSEHRVKWQDLDSRTTLLWWWWWRSWWWWW